MQATVFISLVGICWAVAMWVPFTIIMEVRNCALPVFDTSSTRRLVLKGLYADYRG